MHGGHGHGPAARKNWSGERCSARFVSVVRTKLALLLLACVAMIIRGVVIWSTGPSQVWFGDAHDYLDVATQLCREGRYPWTSSLPFFRPPGLPLFIAAVTGCAPERVVWVKTALSFLDIGTIVLAYGIARGLRMPRSSALLACCLVAIHPLLVQASTDVTTEPLAVFLLAGWLAAIVWGARPDRPHALLWILAGAAVGAAALTRPAAVVCIPLGIAGAFLLDPSRRSRAAGRAAIYGISAAVALAPWTLVASRAAGGFILVTDGGGYNLWRGNHPDLAKASAAPDVETFLRESFRFESETSPAVAKEIAMTIPTRAERQAEWTRRAIDNLRAHPRASARFLVPKARAYWRPWPDRSISPGWLVLLGAFFLVPVLLAGFAGLIRLAWSRPAEATFFALCLLIPFLAQLPFQTTLRFRLPYGEVLLCVLAAGFFLDAGRSIAGRRPSGPRP